MTQEIQLRAGSKYSRAWRVNLPAVIGCDALKRPVQALPPKTVFVVHLGCYSHTLSQQPDGIDFNAGDKLMPAREFNSI